MANYDVYEGVEKVHNNTVKVVVNSAFNRGNHDFLIKFYNKTQWIVMIY